MKHIDWHNCEWWIYFDFRNHPLWMFVMWWCHFYNESEENSPWNLYIQNWRKLLLSICIYIQGQNRFYIPCKIFDLCMALHWNITLFHYNPLWMCILLMNNHFSMFFIFFVLNYFFFSDFNKKKKNKIFTFVMNIMLWDPSRLSNQML